VTAVSPDTHGKHVRRFGSPTRQGARGFTLIELIVVITIAAIISVFLVFFLTTPVESYFAQTRRSDLVDSQDRILRNVAADVRTALAGSLRSTASGNVMALELLATTGVARYYSTGEKSYLPPAQELAQELSIGSPDSTGFYTVGHYGVTTGAYLAVTRAVAASVYYAMTGIMTSQFKITVSNPTSEDHVTLTGGGFTFSGPSPTQSSFIVSGPVTYICDTTPTVQTLRRYWNYPVSSSQPYNPSAAPLAGPTVQSSLVATNVTACTLIPYQPAGSNAGQMLLLRVTLASNGEVLQVFHEISTRYGP
jgi:prepilin-type N-terminal cleavage/methylation domain-containing protein